LEEPAVYVIKKSHPRLLNLKAGGNHSGVLSCNFERQFIQNDPDPDEEDYDNFLC
jgi:hypothetical protein